MARAVRGELANLVASRFFLRYLAYGGTGIIGMDAPDPVIDVARKGGSDIGIVTDCGVLTLGDGRHVVVGVFTGERPEGVPQGAMYAPMARIARACVEALLAPVDRPGI